MKTLRDQYIAALVAKGETRVKETHKFAVYTRQAGGYYYIGKSGSLRFGKTVSSSIPVSETFKAMLIGSIKAVDNPAA